jgi:hypothetical protein
VRGKLASPEGITNYNKNVITADKEVYQNKSLLETEPALRREEYETVNTGTVYA